MRATLSHRKSRGLKSGCCDTSTLMSKGPKRQEQCVFTEILRSNIFLYLFINKHKQVFTEILQSNIFLYLFINKHKQASIIFYNHIIYNYIYIFIFTYTSYIDIKTLLTRFPYVCDLFGIFRDDEFTYVATSLLGESPMGGLPKLLVKGCEMM